MGSGSGGIGFVPEPTDAAVARAGAGVAQGILDRVRDDLAMSSDRDPALRVAFAAALASVAQAHALLAVGDKLDQIVQIQSDLATDLNRIVEDGLSVQGPPPMPDRM